MNKFALTATLLAVLPLFGNASINATDFQSSHFNIERVKLEGTDFRIVQAMQKYNVPKQRQVIISREVNKAHVKYGVDERLIVAMIAQESGFNPRAISSAGAMGLLQIMPVHKIKNPFDIPTSIDSGARILAQYIDQTNSLHGGLVRYGGGKNYPKEVYSTKRKLGL